MSFRFDIVFPCVSAVDLTFRRGRRRGIKGDSVGVKMHTQPTWFVCVCDLQYCCKRFLHLASFSDGDID